MILVKHGGQTHGRGYGSTCGQAALAMIAGVTLETAIEAIGHKHATTYADLIKGLDALRIQHGERKTGEWHYAQSLLCRVRFKKTHYDHWAVFHCGDFYDSAHGIFSAHVYIGSGRHITSFMKVWI